MAPSPFEESKRENERVLDISIWFVCQNVDLGCSWSSRALLGLNINLKIIIGVNCLNNERGNEM